jgi:dipeptide/tripeptide permease
MFVCAFASQYLVGFIIGLFPATASGYSPHGYSWALGLFLAAQLMALAWYLAAPPHKERSA